MSVENYTHHFLQKIKFTNDVVFLFEPFHITTTPGLLFACFVVIVIATVLSILRILKKQHHRMAAEEKQRQSSEATAEADEKTGVLAKKPRLGSRQRLDFLSGNYWIQAAFALVNKTLGTILTLVLVTYNGWLILSVVIGVAIGFSATLWMDDISVNGANTGDEDEDEI